MTRREIGVALLLAITVVTVSVVSPEFLALDHIRDLLVQCVPAAIVGCGLTFVILTGEIDISVGSSMALLAAVLGVLAAPSHYGMPTWAAAIAVVALGGGIGLVNGLLVTRGGIPSIIATLAMLGILRGLTELVMGGRWVTDLPPGVRNLGTGAIAGIPVSLWVAAVVIAASMVLARTTRLGLQTYAVGGNREAAYLAGVCVARVKLFAFFLTGVLTAVATLVSVPRLAVIESGIGVGFELLVVTCVVVGGTSIAGGRGTILGTVLAVLLLGALPSVLIFLKLGVMSTYWERTIQGGFILAAILADHVTRPALRRSAAPRAVVGSPA